MPGVLKSLLKKGKHKKYQQYEKKSEEEISADWYENMIEILEEADELSELSIICQMKQLLADRQKSYSKKEEITT